MAAYSWEKEIGRELYTAPASTAWNLRWWILLAIVCSLGTHSGLYFVFKDLQIGTPVAAADNTAMPDDIRFEDRIALDPKLLEQNLRATPEPIPTQDPPKDFTQDLPSVDQIAPYLSGDLTVTPQITTPQNIQMSMRAKGEMGPNVDILSSVDSSIAGGTDTKLRSSFSERDALKTARAEDDQVSIKIQDRPPDARAPLADLASARKVGDGGLQGLGFSSLDDLMDIRTPQTGDLKSMLPSDLLFDYNSAEVKESAKLGLQKLGLIISTWTKSRVIVEGHTDSIGTEAYNNDLSLRRALSIKNYISRSLMVDVSRMDCRGMGESQPLADPNGDVDQQSLNRRVVIRFINP